MTRRSLMTYCVYVAVILTVCLIQITQGHAQVASVETLQELDAFLKVDWYGDFRLRYEGIFNRDDAPDLHRKRFRFRFGAALFLSPRRG